MDVKHPKRKRDSENPYTLSIENGIKYITFEDSHGHIQTMEISPALFALFDEFELDDISYMNVVSRHLEHSELTEQSLNDRAFQLPESMEDQQHSYSFLPESPEFTLRASNISLRIWAGSLDCLQKHWVQGRTRRNTSLRLWWYQNPDWNRNSEPH